MELEGRVAPPRANGEVVFEAPWQGRIFGMARALSEAGFYEWDEFRLCLIEAIEAWEQDHGPGEDYQYYDLFLRAFTALLEDKGLCVETELSAKSAEFAARPRGHDH